MTPVAVALTNPRAVPNMMSIWATVFVAHILGTLLFSAVIVYGQVMGSRARTALSGVTDRGEQRVNRSAKELL